VRKGWIYAIQVVVSLMVVCGLAIGCAVPSATSPPASEYPADISGHVTIAERLRSHGLPISPEEDKAFWVVDISVKNNGYEHAVTLYEEWRVVAGGEVYPIAEVMKVLKLSPLNVLVGQTGQTTICFSVPDSLTLSQAQICYKGQEPYSYSKLTGGDKVTVYDWDLKKAVAPSVEVPTGVVWNKYWVLELHSTSWSGDTVKVKLSVEYKGNRPQLFGWTQDKQPFGFDEPMELVCSDKYGKQFQSIEWKKQAEEFEKFLFKGDLTAGVKRPFYYKEFYPGEKVSGTLEYTVNPLSTDIYLVVDTGPSSKSITLTGLGKLGR